MVDETPLVPDTGVPPIPAVPPPLPLPVDPPKPYPGLWQGLWVVVRYILLQAVFIVPFAIFDLITKRKSSQHPAVFAAVTLAAGIVSIRWSCARLGMTFRSMAGPWPALSIFPPLVLTVVGLLLAELPLVGWIMRRFPSLVPTQDYGLSESMWGGFVLIVLVAPVIEESLFRGVLLRGFMARYAVTRGILLSAALFGMSHVSLVKLIPTLSLGLLFGWLYSQLGSIWPGVFAHAFNNSLVVVTAFTGMKSKPASAGSQAHTALTAGAELGVCAVGFVLLAGGVAALRPVIARSAAVPSEPRP